MQLILDESKQWKILPFYGSSMGMLQKHVFPNRKNYRAKFLSFSREGKKEIKYEKRKAVNIYTEK